jgi:Carbon dioxide concentrating mechanism/carboxysome shell protein
MILGTVRGNIVSSRKYDNLLGFKLLLVEPYYGGEKILVAADNIGAGVGELVLITMGKNTQYALDKAVPIDALVVGIVDTPPQKP